MHKKLMAVVVAGITSSSIMLSLSSETHASSCWSSSLPTACCYGTTVQPSNNPCERLLREGPKSKIKPFGYHADYPKSDYDVSCTSSMCSGYAGNFIY